MLADRDFRPYVDRVGSALPQAVGDDDMGGSEIACARCGLVAPPHELRLWEQREHYRVFQGPSAGRAAPETPPDAPAPDESHSQSGGIYKHVQKHCAYLTCEKCFAKLRNGATLDDLHYRKVGVYIVILVALGIAAFAAAPGVMPTLLSTFWRTH